MSPIELVGLLAYGMFIGVALAAPIGPINVEIISRGIRHGFRNGWYVGLGALTADTIYATVVVSGLTPIADRPALRMPLFLAGAAMLGWVGVSSLRSAINPATDVKREAPRGNRSYLAGFLIALLNPMGIVYWLSVGAALVAEAVERVGQIGTPVLVIGVFLGLLVWVTTLSVVAQVSRRFVTGNGMRWITGTSGVVILGFAIWFLVQGITAI
ncbi:MAG: LysE family translocator [Chloroflexota bacterium]|nr:LysE family translocator [Chloroflexota bacterium]